MKAGVQKNILNHAMEGLAGAASAYQSPLLRKQPVRENVSVKGNMERRRILAFSVQLLAMKRHGVSIFFADGVSDTSNQPASA